MKEPLKIALWFVVSLGVVAFGLPSVIGIEDIPLKYLPVRSWPTSLLKFERGLAEYRKANDGPKVVLVGASEVMRLPPIGNTYNLGLGSGKFSEQQFIIDKYCSPDDTILYFFTIYEALYYSDAARESLTNASLRKMTIIKGVGRSLRGEYNVKPDPLSLSIENVEKQINRYAKVESVSIAPLREIYESHPNMILIIHPMLPENAWPKCKGAGRLSRLVADMKQQCQKSGLPVIDLSDMLSPESFIGLIHLTDDGERSLCKYLEQIIKASPEDQISYAKSLVGNQ